ncbi:MAG: FAD binding domain-containing protein, partial [Ruthenibacterium sp.]
MQKLEYCKPKTLAEALLLLSEKNTKPFAGGTDLMVQLREGKEKLQEVARLVDISALPELHGIRIEGDKVSIGAMTSHTEAERSPLLQAEAAFLSAASRTVGSPQIRNLGTVGGNICNGSPAADTLSPFVALCSELVICSVNGERRMLVKDIYERAGKISLAADELVTRIEFPRLTGYQTAFLKLGRRKALAISRLNAAVALKMEDGVITDARIVPGCVFGAPDRVEDAEKMAIGQRPSRTLFADCGARVSEEMIARTGVRWSTEYKKPAIEALIERALLQAAGM